MLPSVNPTQTKAWAQLQQVFAQTQNTSLQQLFIEDSDRAERYQIKWNDLFLDYSKNKLTDEILTSLLALADEVGLSQAIELQFAGEKINQTEGRAVLHTALRDFTQMKPEVSDTLAKIKTFTNSVISGQWKGHTGKEITDVVNIGIGGSDLGPNMVCEALRYYRNALNIHFVSNVDGDHVMEVIKDLNPETTLFIIVSKSFTTQETLTNAQTIRRWFLQNAPEEAVAQHFVAVSTNLDAVAQFGIDTENVFPMWDWVGGRFSLWSAVGLSIACAVGYDHFEELLRGAHRMDQHFSQTPFSENIPVVLALLSIWYNNFYAAETEVIVPYSQYLSKLVPYLQQGIMESNGKGVDRNGDPIDYQTGTIVWGSTGTNAQHAFFQLMHQGTKLIPTDFIVFKESLYNQEEHQQKLMANCLAQSEALMQGTYGQITETPFKTFPGDRPSNTIMIDRLIPESLGSLIAMYEHKLFVQGIVWNIYSYDQFGVELGKKLAKGTLQAIQAGHENDQNNASTSSLLRENRSI